jgi:hypothetical protein
VQQPQQLCNVRRNPPRLVFGQQRRRRCQEIIFVDACVNAAAELRCSGSAHWSWQRRSRGDLQPLRIARASCNSTARYYLLGRTRDMTVPLLQMWAGRQRTPGQEFPSVMTRNRTKNFGDIAGKPRPLWDPSWSTNQTRQLCAPFLQGSFLADRAAESGALSPNGLIGMIHTRKRECGKCGTGSSCCTINPR